LSSFNLFKGKKLVRNSADNLPWHWKKSKTKLDFLESAYYFLKQHV